MKRVRIRSEHVGPASRPVATPDDVDSPTITKASGSVELPLHIRWSGPPRTYDLSSKADRLRVYEQVLTEGTDDDVRRFIEVDELAERWDELVLSAHVRKAWAGWFKKHRSIDLVDANGSR